MRANRQTIIGQIEILATSFPSMAADERKTMYVDDIEALGPRQEDLVEAVKRVKHTRVTATFPPFAEIKKHLDDATNDRVKSERGREMNLERERQKPRQLTDTEIRIVKIVRELGMKHGVWWCPESRQFVEPGDEHSCKSHEQQTAIPTLDQCESMLERAQARGWRFGRSRYGKPLEEDKLKADDLTLGGLF